ncbi:MAG: amphi-Trp domain-containing protein [Halobacteria archaeon]|nr:amphi-Trp domain-containing protein [Halobacteria archaeon]
MPEEVLFKSENVQNREEIAHYLQAVADKLRKGEEINLKSRNESISISPPKRITFEVKVERERPTGGGEGEMSAEFELEWKEGEKDETDVGLEIE